MTVSKKIRGLERFIPREISPFVRDTLQLRVPICGMATTIHGVFTYAAKLKSNPDSCLRAMARVNNSIIR